MIGGLQGDFGDLDIKYLKQNISKCRSQISGSFRRTPRHCAKYLRNSPGKHYWHCAKWLRNSPGKRYRRIRICLTEEVEMPSFPIRICLPDVKYPEKMERHPRIVRVCMVQGPIRSNSIWIPQAGIAIRSNSIRIPQAGIAIRSNSIRIPQAGTRRLRTSHTRTIASPIRTRHSRSLSHTSYIPDLLMEKDFKASVLHVSELSIALPWIPNNSPQSWIALVIKLLTKNTKAYTI